jgi:hypothetical protein
MILAAQNCWDMTKHPYCEEAAIGWRRAGGFLNRLTG